MERIEHIKGNLKLWYGDVSDSLSVTRVLGQVRPDELYLLAAQSHVHTSFTVPEYTAQVDAIGTLRMLEGVRLLELDACRIYQASTSELFGESAPAPQNEKTPFAPVSPYAIAKLYAYWIVRCYREAYGMFAVNGILFNHESERRGENFVTRKISLAAANIAVGKQQKLLLGNLDSLRDWGYAPDYVECMWLMLQQDKPDDYVVATGEQHSVREFCKLAFRQAGMELEFEGNGLDEKGYDKCSGKVLVEVSESLFRPVEVGNLLGDPTKLRRALGWRPKTNFSELIKIMVNHDLKLAGL
jgi:GDPmannose 4,6-dehydratase